MRLTSLLRFPLLALVALVGLSAACIQAETAIQVNDNGSGTVSLTQALDTVAVKDLMKEFGDSFGESSTSSSSSPSFDPKDVDTSKLPKGTKVESFKNGNFEGVKLTAPFDKPEDVFAVLNKLSGALSDQTSSLTAMTGGSSSSGGSPGQFDSLTIAKQGDGWKFEAKLAASGAGPGDLDAETKELLDAILKDASVTLKVKLPGKIVESNADSTSNGEMTWKLPVVVDAPKTLTARTSK